ncbi:TPA: ead/Ea22-like family protein [Escherichia coli]|nr:ead/Ea22-like family protein [Escherichia coli]EIA9095836.1 ead/Ea22-like family protein [Escherichia coli]HAX8377514.1 ead/Ea22-like family protein [Escherichia coli]HCB8237736.1 ead/Ea22-like family protein [Escherichia coli]HDY1179445.1 ead/Ea22-like family protein [Escherichia coli]
MSKINYQALREAAEQAMHDDWGFDTDLFHELVTPSIVQALLDEREAKSKLLAELDANLSELEAVLSAMGEELQKATESIERADAAATLAHETFSALAAENAILKTALPQPFGPEMMKALDAYEKHQDEVPEAGMLNAFFILRDSICVETPATDAFLAEVRAQGVDAAIEAAKNLVAQEYEYKDFKAAQSDCCMFPGSDLVGKVEMTEWLVDFAAELRKGGNQ